MQPLIWLYLLFRSKSNPAYRYRFLERYGFCKGKVKPNGILLHSVSVGETNTIIPLVNILINLYPSLPITITTMTPTGSDSVISAFGTNVHHIYLPYDLPCSINRFINALNPKIVIIIETEIWPNMIHEINKRNIPLIIANARLSTLSMKRYNSIFGKFICKALNKVNLIAVQNEEYAKRFISLGIKSNKITIIGNLKFDIIIAPKIYKYANLLRNEWAKERKVFIAASTHEHEELIILKAYRKLLEKFPNLLLIIVPRHQERFKRVRKIVKKANFNFIMRSHGTTPSDNTQIIIGDTIGELILMYGIADLAFVGGSLVKKGGHNPLEPAAHAIPIIMGPYTFNFKDICNKLKQVNSLTIVTDVNSIVENVSNLLKDENLRQLYGSYAIKILHKNKGSLNYLINILKDYLPSSKVNIH